MFIIFYTNIYFINICTSKLDFMKNMKIIECLHLFYIKIKNILNKKEFNLLFPPIAT
jgi:hypothetical protein